MGRKMPIFYSALLLTGVNLLLRLVSTSFQVHISARIGPEGVGLLQLVMSVGSLAMTAGMAGVVAIPHLGASTEEAEDNCAKMAVKQVMNYIENGNIVIEAGEERTEIPFASVSKIKTVYFD